MSKGQTVKLLPKKQQTLLSKRHADFIFDFVFHVFHRFRNRNVKCDSLASQRFQKNLHTFGTTFIWHIIVIIQINDKIYYRFAAGVPKRDVRPTSKAGSDEGDAKDDKAEPSSQV